jgi:hypothetical protein
MTVFNILEDQRPELYREENLKFRKIYFWSTDARKRGNKYR